MATARDEELLRFAVASGQLSEEQAAEVLAALRQVEELGGSSSAAELLTNRGLLSEAQIERLHQAIASSRTATRVPRELAGFELLEKIGQGGMGSVFKARQKELDRLVALKILSPRLSRNAAFVERFLQEARAAGKLNHPNIVAAIDVGEDQGFHYFAMEYVDGETLAAVVAREGRLPEDRALAIATAVAKALGHAFERGLIHRDIKPENIMVTADGRVRVTDFGLARILDAEDDSPDVERFMGTPSYVAPEQIRSEPDIDCRADIFSLGITLFEMLTGDVPFHGANPMAIAAAILTQPLPPIRERCPGVSAATERIVARMTAKDRANRYATPADVVAALEQAAQAPRTPRAPRPTRRAPARAKARPASSRRPAPRRRSSATGTYIAIAAALALLAIAAICLTFIPRKPPPKPPPKVTTPPKTDTGPSRIDIATQALHQRLIEAVADADRFAQQHPRSYASRIARLAAIRKEFAKARHQLPDAGAELYQQVVARLRALEQEAETAARAELARRRKAADEALNEKKLAAAIAAASSFPRELAVAAVASEIEGLEAATRRRAIAVFGKLDAEGQRLIKAGSLTSARAIYAAVTDCPVPAIRDRAKQAIAEIDGRLNARDEKLELVAAEAYPLAAKALVERLAGRRYDDARKLLDAALVEPQLAPVRERLRSLRPLVLAAAEVWGHVAGGVRRLKPGEAVRVAGVGGTFLGYRDGRIHLRSGSVTLAKPLAELRAPEAVAFAQRSLGKPTAEHEAKLALFLLADGDYGAARKRLAAAKANGADVSVAADLLARLAPRPCGTCKGKGTIPCPACGGKGYKGTDRQPCDACNGKGSYRCTRCDGAGSFTCPTCKGTGEEFKGLRCADCGGTGKIRCPRCKGTGEIKCKKCRGTGSLVRRVPCERCRGDRTVPCPECGGRGEHPAPDLQRPALKR